jgi:sortase (surface protein transpeptidase)
MKPLRLILSLCLACTLWLFPIPGMASEDPAPAATPLRLVIPRIGLDAAIEAVGKTASGAMEVPQAPQNVAWYGLGVAPGAQGNAVISGHLDIKAGRAAFWRLRELQVDDLIQVVDEAGVERTFRVIERAIYPRQQAPVHKIFGFDIERDLNLITCTGRWDKKAQTYQQRLVIYARLVTA